MRTKKPRTGIAPACRFVILERDHFTCAFCGSTPGNDRLHVDHIFPYSRGGSDDPLNLVTACDRCNTGKRDRILVPDRLCDGEDHEGFRIWKRFGAWWYLSWLPDYSTMFLCTTARGRYFIELDRVWELDWEAHMDHKDWVKHNFDLHHDLCDGLRFCRAICRKPEGVEMRPA